MINKKLLALLIFVLPLMTRAQPQSYYTDIDQKMAAMPDSSGRSAGNIASYINSNFSNPSEKARAIYYWICNHIKYDNNEQLKKPVPVEKPALAETAVKSGIASIQAYAQLFNELARQCSLTSYIVHGITKQKNSLAHVSHAWNIAELEGAWYCFDTYRGAGYFNGRFKKASRMGFYRVDPATMSLTHYPFDPLWQLSEHPVSFREFKTGKKDTAQAGTVFHYRDTLSAYERQDETGRLVSSVHRIRAAGCEHALANQMIEVLDSHIALMMSFSEWNKYEQALNIFNEAARGLNAFIGYFNSKFVPVKPAAELRKMVAAPRQLMVEARNILEPLSPRSRELRQNVIKLKNSILEAMTQLDTASAFVEKYLKTPKSKRKALFNKK